jgi:hypothetical protein
MLIEDNQDDTIIIVSHKTNKSSILIKESVTEECLTSKNEGFPHILQIQREFTIFSIN